MKVANIDNSRMSKEIFVDDEIINKFFPRYPTTDDGFVESFDINDSDKWMKYLNHYGLVVLKVLGSNEADQTVNSMFNQIYQQTLEIKQKTRMDYSLQLIKLIQIIPYVDSI